MLAGFSLTRGDIVMRGDDAFVVWVHGQGEVVAFPFRNEAVDCSRKVNLAHRGLFKISRLEPSDIAELHVMVMAAATRQSATYRPDGWGEIIEPKRRLHDDGRWHVEHPGSEGCYTVQPCKVTA